MSRTTRPLAGPKQPPLRRLLARRGITLYALARRVQCPEHHLAAVASGRVQPGLRLLRRLARALDMPPGDLIALLPEREVARG